MPASYSRTGILESERITPFDTEMVELALCLPGWQVACLEAEAQQRGWTTGQLLRRLISESCDLFEPSFE
jgi:hypothetical protein